MLKGNQILPINSDYFQNLKRITSEGQIFINIIISVDGELKADPVLYCPSLTLSEDEIVSLKVYLKNEIQSILESCIDDNILGNEVKLLARRFIKKKIGLKPSTHIEIIRI